MLINERGDLASILTIISKERSYQVASAVNISVAILSHFMLARSSSGRDGTSTPLDIQPLEAADASDLLLQSHHQLLVARRISLVFLQSPLQEFVGVVRLEALLQHAESLAVVGDLGPVALDVLQVLREVREAALEDLAVESGAHDGLEVDVLGPRLLGLGEHEVGRFLDGAHERADLVRVLRDELLIADVQDAAEAAAAQLGELVDAEHLNVGLGTVLVREPLFQLDHLHVLEADAGVDLLVDDGFGDIHAAADGGVVIGSHAVVGGELVDLNLIRGQQVASIMGRVKELTFPNSPT